MTISSFVTPRNLYIIALLVIVALTASRLLAPGLIEAAYLGKSFPFLNALIRQQNEYPLAHYLNKFIVLFNFAIFLCVFGAYAVLGYLLFSKANKNTHALSLSERYWCLFGTALVLDLAAYLFTVWPGGTFVNIMTHDMFIFWDGAYRVSQGEIPHLDFHTPIGVLAYFLPYLGFIVSGQMPGALEICNFVVAAWVLAISIHILGSRYRVLPSVIALSYLILIIVVPMNLGTTEIAHAMFYNRYGWVCLSLLYLFYLEPQEKSRRQFWLDVACMSSLIIFMLYLKLTYFVFGVSFMGLMVLVSKSKRRLIGYSMLLLVAAITLVETSYHGLHVKYLKDVLMAIKSSGLVREERNTLGNVINELIFAAIGIFFILKARPLRFYDYCYMALVIVSSLIIINQNYQSTGLVAVIALLLWGHEVSARTNLKTEYRANPKFETLPITTIIFALLIFFVGQPLIERIKGMSTFYKTVAYKRADFSTKLMANMFIGDRASSLAELTYETNPEKLFNDITGIKRAQNLTQGEYIETIEQGLPLIRSINKTGDSVLVFDMANPFSLLLNAKPPVGDYSFYHWKRNINTATYLPGEELFKNVKYLMIPRFPMTPSNTKFLSQTYASYISSNFDKVTGNMAWEIYKKR